MQKTPLIKIRDITDREHYVNQNAIVEFDPRVPNLKEVVAIELSNGHRVFVHSSIAEEIIEGHCEIVLDLADEIVHTSKKKGKNNG